MESDTINKKIIRKKTAQRKRWEIEVGRVFVPMPHESITDMSQFFITRLNGFRSSQSKNDPRIGWIENCILQCGSEDNLATD